MSVSWRRQLLLLIMAPAMAMVFGGTNSIPASAAGADASTESITLSPVSKRYTSLTAGTTTSDSLAITDSGSTAYNFIVYARPYAIINSDYNNPQYGDKANGVANADAYKWASFPQTTYHINPGQTITVPYTLTVPANAAPGGHYGVIFAETQDAGSAGSVARNKRVGMVIYATVKGAYRTGASVSQPVIPFLQLQPPLSAYVSVQNVGNTDLVATVKYRVADIFGNQKYAQQQDYAVLPDTTRGISLQWSKSPAFGLYKVSVQVNALGSNTDQSGYVFMAPYWFYGVIAIIIFGGITYALARRRA